MEGLGFGKLRLVNKIIETQFGIQNPSSKLFNYNELLFVIQELLTNEGKAYLTDEITSLRGHAIFRLFVKHLLFRNLANYDSMLLLTSEKGTGKCVCFLDDSDFILDVTTGRLINNFEDIKKVVSLNMKSYKNIDGDVINRYKRKVNEIYKIETRTGKKIYLTEKHPIFTDVGWKEIKELEINDFIAVPRRYDLKLTKKIDCCIVKLVAYYIADGYSGGRKVEITNSDEDIINEIEESILYFDEKLRIRRNKKILNGKVSLSGLSICREQKDVEQWNNEKGTHRNKFIEFLADNDLYEKRAGDKFIPNIIMELCNEQIGLFLNRLFSCDGCIEYNKRNKIYAITYTSKSERLIRQVQHLLLRFGIISRLRKTMKRATNSKQEKTAYWEIRLSDRENFLLFFNNINVFKKDKYEKIKKGVSYYEKVIGNSNFDVIPRKILKTFSIKSSNKDIAKVLNIKNFRIEQYMQNKCFGVTRDRFTKIAILEDNSEMLKIAESDILWDKIKTIEKITGNFEVWDLEINNNSHNFVVNDIYIHNSSAAIMIAKYWCSLLGIRFDCRRHIAYSNRDVMNKLDMLHKFEPLIADESVRFACVSGDTLIETLEGKVPIRNLENRKYFYVVSYNEKTKMQELQLVEKCIKVKNDYVYEIEMEDGNKIKATKDHMFLTDKGWKKLEVLREGDELIDKDMRNL